MYKFFLSMVVSCVAMSSLQAAEIVSEVKKADEALRVDKKEVKLSRAERKKQRKAEVEQQVAATATDAASSKKTISHMNFEELKKSKIEVVKSGNKPSAIKYLEKMVPVCNDLNELKDIMLELAQLLSETGSYEKAAKMYHEFTILYPGCDEVEFAMYQSIVNSFNLTLDAEHDQSKTMEARELAQTFLERESFTTHRADVEKIVSQCDERLFESEANVFKFYMSRSNQKGAQHRLGLIKETYLGTTIPDIQMRIALLEAECAGATVTLEENKNMTVAQEDTKSFKDRF